MNILEKIGIVKNELKKRVKCEEIELLTVDGKAVKFEAIDETQIGECTSCDAENGEYIFPKFKAVVEDGKVVSIEEITETPETPAVENDEQEEIDKDAKIAELEAVIEELRAKLAEKEKESEEIEKELEEVRNLASKLNVAPTMNKGEQAKTVSYKWNKAAYCSKK